LYRVIAVTVNEVAHYFALFGGFGLLLGYLATSSAKSDVIFLLGDPDFLQGDEISRHSLSFRDLTRGRQTDDRRSDRNRKLLHWQCANV